MKILYDINNHTYKVSIEKNLSQNIENIFIKNFEEMNNNDLIDQAIFKFLK